ncbi:MAG: hypothetical protein K6U87_09230 [Firmicutes bacterium]|nr:hypothetical protein [Bacillota bacterium]
MTQLQLLQLPQAKSSAAMPAQATGGEGSGRFAAALSRARKPQGDRAPTSSQTPSSPSGVATPGHSSGVGRRGRLRRRDAEDTGPPQPLQGLAPVVVPAAQTPVEGKAPAAPAADLIGASTVATPDVVTEDTPAPRAAPSPPSASSPREAFQLARPAQGGEAAQAQGGSPAPALGEPAGPSGVPAPRGAVRADPPVIPASVQGGVRLAQASATPDPTATRYALAPGKAADRDGSWPRGQDAGPPSQGKHPALASPRSLPERVAAPGVSLRLKPGRRALSGGNAQGPQNPNVPVGLAPHKLRTGAVSPAAQPATSPGHTRGEAAATSPLPPKAAGHGTWRVEGTVRPTVEGTLSQWRIKPFGKPPLYVAVSVHPSGAAASGGKAIGLTVQLPSHHPWASELATLTPGLSQHLADLHGGQARVEVWVGGGFGGSGFSPSGQQDRPLWAAVPSGGSSGERPSEGSGPVGSGSDGVDFRA